MAFTEPPPNMAPMVADKTRIITVQWLNWLIRFMKATGGGGGGGTISSITSTGGTVTITNPAGPTTNLEVTTPAGPAANITPDTHPSSPTVFDDEFEFGTSIDLTGARRAGALPWAWTNQNSSTAVVTQGSLVLTPIAGGGRNTAILLQSLSGVSAPWTFTTKICADAIGSGAFAGMVLGGTAGFVVFGISGTNNTTLRWNVQNQSNPTTLAGNVVTAPTLINVWNFTGPASSNALYLQINLTALALTFSASITGVPGSFVTIGTATLASFIVAVTGVGIAADLGGGGSSRGVYDWFRKTL